MKLNQKKIRWIIRQKDKGESAANITKVMKISKRRVDQIYEQYRKAQKEPIIGKSLGRPMKTYDPKEAEIIIEAYDRFKFGARMLEPIIRKYYNTDISHNRIHMYLLSEGLSVEEKKKKRRRKWVRYERKHSMSAGHIDWHEGKNGAKVCVVLDDASRKILAGGEFANINTENSKEIIDQLVRNYWMICPLRELIMDHGSEFGAHRRDEKGNWDSGFKNQLQKYGIKVILARIKHPQTNGKVEKWFDNYRRLRQCFTSFEEHVYWYNNRPHGSLKFDELETPEQAF